MAAASFFRKKPFTVSAMQFDGTQERAVAIGDWMAMQGAAAPTIVGDDAVVLTIQTLEGTMTAGPDDWVIRGVAGEFYPCKPDIFAATYEAAN